MSSSDPEKVNIVKVQPLEMDEAGTPEEEIIIIEEQKFTVFETALAITSSIIGGGIISVPYAMSVNTM